MTGEDTDSLAGGAGMECLVLRIPTCAARVLESERAVRFMINRRLFRKPDWAGKKPKGWNPRRVSALQCCAAYGSSKAGYLTTRGHRLGLPVEVSAPARPLVIP